MKQSNGALVLPIGSRVSLEPNQFTTGGSRRRRGIVEYDPLALHRVRQGSEERHVLLAGQADDLLGGLGRGQRQVGKNIPPSTAHSSIGLRAEGDVVGGRQKSRVDQAPSGGKNVRSLKAEAPRQGTIDAVLIQLECGQQAKRIVAGARIVSEKLIPPRSARVGFIVGPRVDTASHRTGELRMGDERDGPAIRRFQTSGIRSLAAGALDDDDQGARSIFETSLSKQPRNARS